MELRQIFNAKISPTKAMGRMNKWYEKVMALGNNNFRPQMRGVRDRDFFIFRLVKLYT